MKNETQWEDIFLSQSTLPTLQLRNSREPSPFLQNVIFLTVISAVRLPPCRLTDIVFLFNICCKSKHPLPALLTRSDDSQWRLAPAIRCKNALQRTVSLISHKRKLVFAFSSFIIDAWLLHLIKFGWQQSLGTLSSQLSHTLRSDDHSSGSLSGLSEGSIQDLNMCLWSNKSSLVGNTLAVSLGLCSLTHIFEDCHCAGLEQEEQAKSGSLRAEN